MIGTVRILALMLATVLAVATPALAVQPDEMLADPAKEQLARSISAELRCLVCQNQSIDDSDAPLARDLRILVREHVQKGEDREEIMNFLVERYGDFVLLRPRFTARNLLLWLAPVLLLLAGGILVYRTIGSGRPREAVAPAPLSDAEKAKLASIVDDKG